MVKDEQSIKALVDQRLHSAQLENKARAVLNTDQQVVKSFTQSVVDSGYSVGNALTPWLALDKECYALGH